jgi:hypothetical protein
MRRWEKMSDIARRSRIKSWVRFKTAETEAPELLGRADEIKRLRAEIERFREALRAIRDLDGNPYEQDHVHLAKEALGEDE